MQGQMVGPQQLDRMAEADPIGPHHPVDGRPARVARSHAVPEVLRRSDDQRRTAVVVERAEAMQVGPQPLQLDPSRLRQPLHRDLSLQPLDLILRDSRHFSALRLKPCQVLFMHLLVLPVACKLVPRVYGYVYHVNTP
jgi:hypothetical protein